MTGMRGRDSAGSEVTCGGRFPVAEFFVTVPDTVLLKTAQPLVFRPYRLCVDVHSEQATDDL